MFHDVFDHPNFLLRVLLKMHAVSNLQAGTKEFFSHKSFSHLTVNEHLIFTFHLNMESVEEWSRLGVGPAGGGAYGAILLFLLLLCGLRAQFMAFCKQMLPHRSF